MYQGNVYSLLYPVFIPAFCIECPLASSECLPFFVFAMSPFD